MDYNHFILSLASSQIFNTNNYYELCKIHFPNIKEEDFFKDLQQAQNNLYSFSLKKIIKQFLMLNCYKLSSS